MEGFYDRCKELFDAGKRAEFIRYCRDSMAAQITINGVTRWFDHPVTKVA